MGSFQTKTLEEREDRERSKKCDEELKKYKKGYGNNIKILLLGTGDSGKSTIAKQLKILHSEGFSLQERQQYREVIFGNIISSIQALIEGCEKNHLKLFPENANFAEELLTLHWTRYEILTVELCEKISSVWKDPSIQRMFEKRHEIQVMDGASFFLDNLIKFCQTDYVPSDLDIIHARARSTGIVEIHLLIDKMNFYIIDVGGQRSERRKWIHCFSDITSVLYCIAMNEYDMTLFESATTNRMKESLELFEQIVNSRWFNRASIIVFFNKFDLFQKKIVTSDLSQYFPEYKGGFDVNAGSKFIIQMFLSKNHNPTKRIYEHITTAIEKENVRFVFNASKANIIAQNLERMGIGVL